MLNKISISLKEDSEYKEIQDLYKTGFNYEQILAIVNFIIAFNSRQFHKIN